MVKKNEGDDLEEFAFPKVQSQPPNLGIYFGELLR